MPFFIGVGATLCPCGWVKLESSCYYFSYPKKSWDNARSYCLSRGGDLAIPTNKKEDIAIINKAKQLKLTHLWFGLVRRYDKKFFTVYGLTPKYTNWFKGEPNDVGKNENCAHYWVLPNKKAWNDAPCSIKHSFICEDKRSRRELN